MNAFSLAIAAALSLLAGAAGARTLSVGPGQEFAVPSLAARAALDGDVVAIAPGTYYDCSVWRAQRLTIAGTGPGAVLTDTTCQGKAILVLDGDGATIRDLTLARARVEDRNGAGIRLEAQGLTLQGVRFINDEVGLLAGTPGPGRIRITDCLFEQGGVGATDGAPATYAIWVGAVALLQIERTTIRGVKGGAISTAADYSVLNGNTLSSGTGDGPEAVVQASAGGLLMQDNTLTLGPTAPARAAAVWAARNGETILRRNRLLNTTGRPATLLLDWSRGGATLDANVLAAGDSDTSSSGLWRNQAAGVAHGAVDLARGLAGGARHLAGDAKRRLLGP